MWGKVVQMTKLTGRLEWWLTKNDHVDNNEYNDNNNENNDDSCNKDNNKD